MGKKSEKRAKRKAQKQERFEEAKASFVQKVSESHQPKYISDPDTPKIPHVASQVNQAAISTPKAIKDGGRFGEIVTWCVKNKDIEGKWSWHCPRQWTDEEWNTDISPHFEEFSQKTWAEIDELASGSGHKMHHDQEISTLIKEARRRWKKLGFEQFDTAFRFRLGGTKRAWGYIVQSHFFFVWWERKHKIYPTNQ